MFIKNFVRMNEGASGAAPVTTQPAQTAAPSRHDGIKAATEAFLKPAFDAEEQDAWQGYDFSEFEGNTEDPVAGSSGVAQESGKEDTATANASPQFTPYSYKGSVLGKEVEQTFSSQKELDTCIQRGLAAPQIYENFQKLQEKAQTLQQDSNHVNELYDMAKNSPKDFLELVFDELIDEAVAADWVYDKFQHFSKVAKLSPEEREHQRKLKDAERIIEEQRALRRQQEMMAEMESKKGLENDRKYVTNWKTGTVEALKKEIPPMYHNNIKEAMDLVMLRAKALCDADPKMTVSKACSLAEKQLKALLDPYKRVSTPEAAKKQVGDALAAKSQQATQKLQGIASSKQGGSQPPPQKPQKERFRDAFKEVQWRLSKGAGLKT